LDPETRGQVDAQLNAAGITRMGFRTATACIRKAAYQADRHGYLQRAAGPNANTAGSGSGQHLTPWRCSPATSQWNKASPATPHYNNTPMRWWPPVMAGAGIRSWPTPWWNASPDKPQPPM
ncbi:MAG TPA: hypothetical protein VJ301_16765, partial [Propionibacteriaceae bacterium]|nr:hypothetical protein [Propionibacteriaceae bacterium]